ncbi:hypothetical protein [Variovorax atrisoli]|uniref:hypothetical protein n=1 Tax=Variovorax atrisoli TaxID=3394203 RepID=UPI003394E117
MAVPTPSKAVVALGKRLVAQLKQSDDLLAQWMAHDIAARMEAVEAATSAEARCLAEDRCAKSILSLWKHQNELPPHLRPFRELESLVRTLVSLDVDIEGKHRYSQSILREAALHDTADPEMKQWLELAIGLDYSARLLIRYALQAAGATAAARASPWLEAAMKAGSDPALERHVIKFVLPAFPDDEEVRAEQQASLQEKIEKLDAFATLATGLAAHLRTQLDVEEASKREETRGLKRPRTKREGLRHGKS